MNNINCVVVCGPTASGKTRLAVTLANKFNGEIISADSRQVYRGMDIGTGKDLHEYITGKDTVAVHLIDIVNPADIYTVYHFQRDFSKAFEEIRCKKHLPILTGGTGLYIESVIRNYNIPAIPENAEFREKYMSYNKEFLINELLKISPAIHAQTDLSSKKRIVRALEIANFSGQNKNMLSQATLLHPFIICTKWERSVLHERIDTRLNQRLQQGMVDEVKHLLKSGVPQSRLIQFGMEYKHIVKFLDGEIQYEGMVNALKRDIHKLAKRQETWFRGMERRGMTINWIENSDPDSAIKLIEQVLCDNGITSPRQ